jgi:hypothetical protein
MISRSPSRRNATREVKLASVLKAEATGPKPPVAKPAEGDTDATDTETESKFDVHLRETLRVVNDAMRLNSNPVAWVESQPAVAGITSLHKG